MIYLFMCEKDHPVEVVARNPMPYVECPLHSGLNTPAVALRDFASELRTHAVLCDDPIRKSFNGAKIDHNLAAQGRPLDPLSPKDKFDLRRIEKATGRVYCGDDISHLRPNAQKAILEGTKPKGCSTPRL